MSGANKPQARINVNGIAPGVVDNEHWDHVDAMLAFRHFSPSEDAGRKYY